MILVFSIPIHLSKASFATIQKFCHFCLLTTRTSILNVEPYLRLILLNEFQFVIIIIVNELKIDGYRNDRHSIGGCD